MTLKVVRAGTIAANTPFSFIVPAQETWKLISVSATLSRAVGGLPNRALRLTITDGTSTILASPAADAGTEPGTLTVTWANANATTSTSGATGTTLGPIANVSLLPGYVLTGTVLNGPVTDQWSAVAVWCDWGPT